MPLSQREDRPSRPTQSVREDEIVSLSELRSRLGLGPAAIRTARRQGLTVRRFGRKKFVLGSDLASFLRARPGC